MKTIVAIDDEPAILQLIERGLARSDWRVITYDDPLRALERIAEHGADVVILDLKMPQAGGIEVLKRCRALVPGCKVVILTGHGGVREAVEAMKHGAADFFSKPLRIAELAKIVSNQLNMQTAARAERTPSLGLHGVAADSCVRRVFELGKSTASGDSTVLITGETGSGKEVLADYIQRNSPRASMPYIKVNCAALPANLIESELFGHEKGAFTGASEARVGRFERAHLGTLFLDEVGELPLPLQAKLLRVLQSREIERVGGSEVIKTDFRLICATHRDLAAMVRAGTFREDLYYRIEVLPIRMPALRERPMDIPVLLDSFLARVRTAIGRGPTAVSPQAMQVLMRYTWPGNVRELENVVERAAILCQGGVLHAEDLAWLTGSGADAPVPVFLPHSALDAAPAQGADTAGPPMPPLAAAERQALLTTLERNKWNFTRAARELQISRSTLYVKAGRYAISR